MQRMVDSLHPYVEMSQKAVEKARHPSNEMVLEGVQKLLFQHTNMSISMRTQVYHMTYQHIRKRTDISWKISTETRPALFLPFLSIIAIQLFSLSL